MTTLLQKLEETILSRALLARGDGVLVATSGGVDSMVLLYLLNALAPKYKWHIHVAHFDHKLRGRSSSADARLVKRTARHLNLAFHGGCADVRSHAVKRKLSLEMAARELRHNFLSLTAQSIGIQRVALAHHADDQVELFFLRVLRGAGGDGLGGMKWQSVSPAHPGLQLIRPLLGFGKTELMAFAHSNKINFREDASNASSDFLRNRIRRELLPLLRRQYEPALNDVVLRTMEITGDDALFAEQAASKWLNTRRPRFSKLAPGLQRRILRFQFRGAGIEAGFELIESLRHFPNAPVNLQQDLQATHNGDGTISVKKCTREEFKSDQLRIGLKETSGRTTFGLNLFHWQRSSTKRQTMGVCKPNTECFDSDKVGNTIILRHWRAGDRFQPIGMSQTVKLQDWFTNRKIPHEVRRKLVVATTSSGDIFWIEGERIGEKFKLSAETREQLIWTWSHT